VADPSLRGIPLFATRSQAETTRRKNNQPHSNHAHKEENCHLRRRERKSKGSQARKAFAFVACRILQFPLVQVAGFLGCSSSAVSWSARQGEQLVSQEDRDQWANLPPG
jgi:hypothetical protein